MRNVIVKAAGLLLAVGLAIGSSACAARTINQVLADPGRYRERQVTLRGSVVNSFSIVGRGAYEIRDSTGSLWVVSDKGVPREGSDVSVKGTVREGFSLGSLGDLLRLPQGVRSGVVLMESSHKAR